MRKSRRPASDRAPQESVAWARLVSSTASDCVETFVPRKRTELPCCERDVTMEGNLLALTKRRALPERANRDTQRRTKRR